MPDPAPSPLSDNDRLALRAFGWNDFFESQLGSIDETPLTVARVSAHYGIDVEMRGADDTFRLPVRLADSAGKAIVGDWLVLTPPDQRAIRRLERTSLLERKSAGSEVKPQALVANVDTAFVVSSCNEAFNLSGIERYLAMTIQAGATPVVVLTKADLAEDGASYADQVRALRPGLVVELLDGRDPEQASALDRWCGPGQSVALLGASGVGKSTLANALGAGDQATGAIREKDGKGRHTTTSRSLHLLPAGGVLLDNPGVRELQLPECEDGVADLFEDVLELIAACRFSDCRHDAEPGCAIKNAIESGELDDRRYQNFLKLKAEQARNARVLAARAEREAAKAHRAASRKRRRAEER